MPADEVLLYPRTWQDPSTGRTVDASPVIAFFLVGQPFNLRTKDGVQRFRITRIDREGIWGVPDQ
jgi:hypothetical protein